MSGEDSLFSRLAHRLGLRGAYEPSLHLRHYISESRLSARYLARLSYGHGRSFVLLARLMGEQLGNEIVSNRRRHLVANFWHRAKQDSFVHALGMYFWDRGYLDEISGQ